MTRRVALPGAAELFRTTVPRTDHANPSEPAQTPAAQPAVVRSGSGRRKHDSKITVYVSDEELLGLEQARLALRAHHGIAVDRGRVVREAVAAALADLDERGADSELVRRLREPGE
jgi:L-aminopeptidase/D-esterase-like protein